MVLFNARHEALLHGYCCYCCTCRQTRSDGSQGRANPLLFTKSLHRLPRSEQFWREQQRIRHTCSIQYEVVLNWCNTNTTNNEDEKTQHVCTDSTQKTRQQRPLQNNHMTPQCYITISVTTTATTTQRYYHTTWSPDKAEIIPAPPPPPPPVAYVWHETPTNTSWLSYPMTWRLLRI